MTDREMLQFAAKAAGYSEPNWPPRYDWNPRDDDGEAFRLAVELRKMPVIERWSEGDDWVFIPGHEDAALPLGNDPLAATRLAITRAAAEIGKGMK